MTVLHHEIAGAADAPVLLMGGSLGTTLRMWDGQRSLAGRLCLVLFDHRGHGQSPVPPGPYEIADLGMDVLELMDRRGLERVHYCGLSIGGMVGMWLGANAPERVDRLILLCTAAYMPPASMWQERAQTVLQADSVEPLVDATLERWLTPEFVQSEVRASLRAMLVGTPPSWLRRLLRRDRADGPAGVAGTGTSADAGRLRRPRSLDARRAAGADHRRASGRDTRSSRAPRTSLRSSNLTP